MVKKRQSIDAVDFAQGRPLGLEVLTLQELFGRETNTLLARPHRPTFHHLVLVTRGEGTHTIDFVRRRVRAGTVFHVAPGQVHQFGREPTMDAWMLVFEPDFVRRHLPPVAPVRIEGARGESLSALFGITAREFSSFDGSARHRGLLRTLVECIAAAIDVGPSLPEGAHLVEQFRAALERSFREAHEVAAYAAILRCSTRTLTRHCEQWAGKSAKRLIDERVILEARRELAHGEALVSELSEMLGFSEPTQFVKFFRRVTGDTPARFRAQLQSGREKR
jgi:AraC-like DNA-binding protein